MNAAPILILQMQRMGDLILTFPLLGWLQKKYQQHPLWVVGEKMFFEPLMSLSPKVTYFSYDAAPQLQTTPYHLVVNLSHRPEAAALAGSVRCDELVGPYLTKDGALHIKGDWQLYRASLTNNNRYNRFHWTDLNALDCVPLSYIRNTRWPLPRAGNAGPEARLGLFLGASEPEKHPEAPFWAELARKLIQHGQKPVLLGGDKEKELGAETAGILNAPALDLTGRFTIHSLAEFIAQLDVFITPDTGPMHLAAWTGTPTINLSMGPVSAWETGPFAPGHHVLRSKAPCQGCWRCGQRRVFCKEDFSAASVAALAVKVLQCSDNEWSPDSSRARLPGRLPDRLPGRNSGELELLLTGRDKHGLYDLKPLAPQGDNETGNKAGPLAGPPDPWRVRDLLGQFWKAWFGSVFGIFPDEEARSAWLSLEAEIPSLALRFREELAHITRGLSKAMLAKSDFAEDSFWAGFPAMLRPLSGYLQMYIRNDSASRRGLLAALSLVERIGAITA